MIPRTGERPKTIVLVADLGKYHREGWADTTGIYPGMAVEPMSSSEDVPTIPPRLRKQSTAGQDAPIWIVKEDYTQGKTINDAYADVDLLLCHECQKGDTVLARVASGTNWSLGTLLGFAGNGLFAASGTKRVLRVMEAYDGSEDTTYSLIRCQAI